MISSSCQLLRDEKRSVFITDKDFFQFSKSYSPDSAMILLNYGIDEGALGYGHAGTVILKLRDTVKNLRLFTLPNIYSNVQWIDNKTVAASYDVIPDLREGVKPKGSNKTINGVKVIIEVNDGIGKNFHLKIEHREISPNGKKEFVAYRYTDNKTFTPIHIR